MALKITIVICLTIISIFVIILLILATGRRLLEAQNKDAAEEMETLKAKLYKTEVHAGAVEKEMNRLQKENLELRRRHNDFGLLGGVNK